MKKIYALCLSFFAFALISSAFSSQILADGGCLTVNNGGITNKQVCPTPAPTSAPIATTNNTNNQRQNNDGHTVYSPSKTKSTPNTGPEDWSVPTLLFLAGIGFLLRNRTKLSTRVR